MASPASSSSDSKHQNGGPTKEELKQEYDKMTRFYGVKLQLFFGDVYNAILDTSFHYIEKAEKAIVNEVSKKDPTSTDHAKIVKDSLDKFIDTKLSEAIKVGADGFEQYSMSQVFKLPRNFDPATVENCTVLPSLTSPSPSSTSNSSSTTTASEDTSAEEIRAVQEKIAASLRTYNELVHENRMMKQQQAYFDVNKESLEKLEDVLSESKSSPLDIADKLQKLENYVGTFQTLIEQIEKLDNEVLTTDKLVPQDVRASKRKKPRNFDTDVFFADHNESTLSTSGSEFKASSSSKSQQH